MNQTEQLIEVGRAYIDALNNLKEDNPETLSPILDIMDCVHLDRGYELGVVIEEPSPYEAPSHMCDQAWFFCYKGDDSPIIKRPYKSKNGGYYNYGKMCYLRFTFDLFNHITIDPTPMGAWQAYLLSIAKTLLPFSGGLYYTKRKLIFAYEQLKDINLIDWGELKHGEIDCIRHPGLTDPTVNISPCVRFDGKQAIVSCCHWNDWGGLIREDATITFFNDRVYLFDDFEEEKLFNYDIGIRF